jgi:hypothetical protein
MSKKDFPTKKELLNYPKRSYNVVTMYEYVYLVPTGKKHDSGFMIIALVGENHGNREIAAYCDDIYFDMQLAADLLKNNHISVSPYHVDMLYSSGISRMWSNKYYFEIGFSLSSTQIKLIPKI